MEAGFTAIPNDLFEAVLRFKCPDANKKVIFAVIRLTEGYHQSERALSISYLSKFLKTDRSNIAKRLNALIEANVLKETSSPGYQEARHIEINRNFREWTPGKKETVKGKTNRKNLPTPPSDTPDDAALENISGEQPENTTVVNPTTPPVVESATNKDTSSALSENKTVAVAVVLKKGDKGNKPHRQLNGGNLEEMLKTIYERSLHRLPNLDEVCELKEKVIEDTRFSMDEHMEILKNAFHRVSLCHESKKHTVYILGIIRSMKLDILKKRDKALKEQEMHSAAQKKFTSWDEAGFSLIEDYRNQLKIKN